MIQHLKQGQSMQARASNPARIRATIEQILGDSDKTHTCQRILIDEACVVIGDYCSQLCGYEHMPGLQEQADIRVRRLKQEA